MPERNPPTVITYAGFADVGLRVSTGCVLSGANTVSADRAGDSPVNNGVVDRAKDGALLTPVMNERVITGQMPRVNHPVSTLALPTRWIAPTPTVSHSAAGSPSGEPSRAGYDVIPVYRDWGHFPFGHFSPPFELKTYGIIRAEIGYLQAPGGKGRFRKSRG